MVKVGRLSNVVTSTARAAKEGSESNSVARMVLITAVGMALSRTVTSRARPESPTTPASAQARAGATNRRSTVATPRAGRWTRRCLL